MESKTSRGHEAGYAEGLSKDKGKNAKGNAKLAETGLFEGRFPLCPVELQAGCNLWVVTFEGFIAPRPKMEGDGLEPPVVVERFLNVWPGKECERDAAK